MSDHIDSRHWSLETVLDLALDIPIHQDSISISVKTEVPMRGTERIERRGNRYYPTLIDLELSHPDLTLHAETARELADMLIKAANAADAADNPDTDVCGHWWPCDCDQAKRSRLGAA